MLILNTNYSKNRIDKRYQEGLIGDYSFYNDYVLLGQQLKELGLTYKDKVIVSSDRSPNISLYLMDQIGWTQYPYGIDKEKMEHYKDEGAQYLISRKQVLEANTWQKPYTDSLVLEHNDILVYFLKAN